MKNILVFPSLILSSLIISACTSMRPLPVQEPTAVSTSETGIPSAKTEAELLANLKTYGNFYFEQAAKLRSNQYSASDTTFVGSTIGVIGGVISSVTTAIVGGLVGGGGTTASSRYKYSEQALNYEQASDAMFCMRKRLSLSNYKSIDNDQKVIIKINDSIDEVRQNLRKRQLAVVFAEGNSQSIADQIRKSIEAQEKQKKINEEIIIKNTELSMVKKQLNLSTMEKRTLNSKGGISNTKRLDELDLSENQMINEIDSLKASVDMLTLEKTIADNNVELAKLLEDISFCIAPK